MHPGFYAWWRERAHGHFGGAFAYGPEGHGPGVHGHGGHGHGRHGQRGRGPDGDGNCGRGFGPFGHRHEHGASFSPGFEGDPSSPFGVRRPLRFLAHKLELNEAQVNSFAGILEELKTERAQASVDQRRRISALADALEGASFDAEKADTAGQEQVKSAERLRGAVEHALRRIHGLLDDEQRKKLAYLLRTGMLSI